MKALKPLSLFIIHYSLFFSVALIVACSDWDEHFDAERQVVESQKASLWQNIVQSKWLVHNATPLHLVWRRLPQFSGHTILRLRYPNW